MSQNVDWAKIPAYTYSESERIVGRWVDDSPIYRKVINLTLVADGNWHDVPGGTGIKSLISVKGYFEGGTEVLPLPYSSASYSVWFSVDTSRGQLRQAVTNGAPNNRPAVIIVEYTKTNS